MKPAVYLLWLALIVFSCRREESAEIKTFDELVVSDSFRWETVSRARLTVQVDYPSRIGKMALIKLYDKAPAEGGVLLASGSAGYNYPWEVNLVIPAGVTSLTAQLMYAGGLQQTAELTVADQMAYTFTEAAGKEGLKMVPSEPPCEGDQVISGSGNVTIRDGLIYLVSGTFSGNLNFQNGTLLICGEATLNDVNVSNNCAVIVTSTGSLIANNITLSGNASFYAWKNTQVRFNQLNQNNINSGFYNYSDDIVLSGSVGGNGRFFNDGILLINGGMNRNAGGYFLNYGSITLNGTLNMNQDFENYGSIQVGQAITFNTQDYFINDCKLIAGGDVSLNNGTLSLNGGFIQTPGAFTINGGGDLEMYNQAMIATGSMTVNQDISGGGTTSTILVSGISTINGMRTVSGPIEWADNDGVLTNGSAAGSFVNGASFVSTAAMTNFIPPGDCNPVGTGTGVAGDSDGDGVDDSQDEYADDPARAFNIYYPSEEGWAGLAFEDLWPEKGDYDFNDLVVRFRYQFVSNAANKIVELKASYQATAVGAAYRNGFGVQFDNILPNQVSEVTGQVRGENYILTSANGTEANQQKAVVIPWDNVEAVIQRAGGSMFNTVPNGFVGTSDIVDLLITFVHPLHPDSVGTPPFNPFLIRQMRREHEIHLVDKQPTTLMDMNLFKTLDDASEPTEGRYFRTSENLTWGIQLPEEFDYPVEHAEVTEAHLKFSSWAESNGDNPHDWYKDRNGYRNPVKIYKK